MPVMLGAWLRGGLRLLPWLLLLGGLAFSGWWRYYLAPRHMPYLWAGLGVLALVLLASELDGLLGRAARRRAALLAHQPPPAPPRPANMPDVLEAAVHWLPLLMLLALGPTTLSLRGGAPSSRQLSRLRAAPASQAPAAPAAQVPAPKEQSAAPDAPVLKLPAPVPLSQDEIPNEAVGSFDGSAAEPARPPADSPPAAAAPADAPASTSPPARAAVPPAAVKPPLPPKMSYAQTDLVKLFTGRGGPPGNPVEVTGRLHKVAGDDVIVPLGVDPASVEIVLYRYAIFCCVADAVPATAILEGGDLAGFEDEQWVKLRGRFHQTGATGDIPLLKVDSVEPIPEPADPYLFTGPDDL